MPEVIEVNISAAGSVKIDAQGFTGNGCAKATERLELVLGGGSRKQDKKPEYHMPASSQSNHNQMKF